MPATDKELLFNDLLQPHWDNFAREVKVLIQQQNIRPKVFISYAWPSSRYPGYDLEKDIQPWLLGLYERLTGLGATVLFDIKTMTLGTNIDQFMQQGVDSCDAVLIIGTQTYKTRSEENTNVKREVEHIQQKIQQKGSNCVVPILYRGEFHTALPNLGQILGTSCSDEFLYQENLPVLIEGLFGLLNHAEYQALKQKYLAQIKDIKAHGLSDAAVADFAQNRAQKTRAALEMQRQVVSLMLERNAKGHPDYIPKPIGAESPSVKMLSSLKEKYSRYTNVQALFGEPMALEGQYINVQMLYQVLEEKKEEKAQGGDDEDKNKTDKSRKEFIDTRVTSFETIFSKKEPLAINQLFTPAKQLLTEKQKTHEAKPDLPPNFVLLQGRAGIGKTTFVNFVTREWALGRLWQEYNWVFSLRFRDLRSGAIQQAAEKKETWTLSDWIYTIHFASQMDKASFQSLWTWLIEPDLKSNKVLFILDGYDETPTQHPCEQALSDLLNSSIPKILTSRPYGLSDLPKDKRELEIVGFIDENVDKYVSIYFKQDDNKAKAITQGLRGSSSLWGSAHIPVTLNVLCGVLETESDIPTTLAKLNTMGGLYETMEMSLLERAYVTTLGKEKEHAQQLKPLDKDSKIELLTAHYKLLRQYLAKLAFIAFSKQQLILTPQDVTGVLKEFGVPVTQMAASIKELLELGLLKKVVDEVTHEDTNYEFLHLTFQEYYSGRYLLWQVEQNSPTILEDFAKIKLDPRYQLVLWFVAGTIKNKKQFNLFMRAIAAPQGADMLGNVQLGLMIRCTEENWELAQQTGWTNAITKMLQHRIHGAWKRYQRNQFDNPPIWIQMLKISGGYEAQTGHLDLFAKLFSKAANSDNETQKKIVYFIHWLTLTTPAVLNILAKLLAGSHELMRQDAADACGKLGPKAATSEILAQITRMLAENNSGVRFTAANVIGKFGIAAATPEILTQITKMLTESNSDVRITAVNVIGKLGVAAVTPKFLVQLAKLLAENNSELRSIAVNVIEKLGTAVATPAILIELAKLLAESNSDVCLTAVNAIDKLGVAAATPAIVIELAKLLAASDNSVREAVAKTCGNLGPKSATPAILTQLAKLLADSNEAMRKAALDAIDKLGTSIATPEFIAQLAGLLAGSDQDARIAVTSVIGNLVTSTAAPEIFIELAKLLTDSNWRVREVAARACGNLDIATSEILAQLAKLLADNTFNVRKATANAIGSLGAKAATSEILIKLAKLLDSGDENMRQAAASACGKLGPKAAVTPEIITPLITLLVDKNEQVRKTAANAIGNLGAVAATPEILAQLAKLLAEDKHWKSYDCPSIATINACGKIGAAAATPEIITQLAKLLVNSHENVCKATANAIGNLGAAAATPEIITPLVKLLTNNNSDVRIAAATAIDKLDVAAVTPELTQLAKLLTDNNIYVRRAATDTIDKLGSTATISKFLIQLDTLLAESSCEVSTVAAHAQAIGKFGVTTAIPKILAQLLKMMADNTSYVREAAVEAINSMGVAAAKPMMVALIKLLPQIKDEHFFIHNEVAQALTKLINLYLCQDLKNILPEDNDFPSLSTSIVVSCYLIGNISFYIHYSDKGTIPTYHLRGFADKNPFNIPINHQQAQWFIN